MNAAMIAREKIQQIVQRFGFLEAKLSGAASPDELAALSKEYADLKPVAEEAQGYLTLLSDLEAAEGMLDDPEMAELAKEEIASLEAERPRLEEKMRLALIPRDAADAGAAILEIRPGTGGDEAALFAGDLWRMYARFAEAKGWRAEVLDQSQTELGGVKELT
ncbi:MAG: PCRF domain-containing protein, partial [Pseudomonadota bacterium]